MLAAFVGEKYDSYYRNKWFENSEPRLEVNKEGASIYSFNIAGFLFGAFWLCYRKMYKLALLIMFVVTIIDLILIRILGSGSYGMSGNLLFIATWIIFSGFLGNYFYFNTSVRVIKEVSDSTKDIEVSKQTLAIKGGASWAGAIVGGLLLIVMSSALSYFFAPDWYWLV